VTDPERLDLAKRRETSELLNDAVRIYFANFGTVFAIAAAIVVPVQLIVSGVGLEELTSGYRETSNTAEQLIPVGVSFLVVAPLIAAAMIGVLRDLANGERAQFRRSLQLGLDAFTPVFIAVLIAGAGIALGLLLFIIPGIYVAVRWLFVPQAVVVDNARGANALRTSWALTQGFWWRTFLVVLLANLIALLPGLLIVAPLEALASSADSQAISLAGMVLTETLTAPFVAIVSVLLFFDLRARAAAERQPPLS
jgi:hypothetical protein